MKLFVVAFTMLVGIASTYSQPVSIAVAGTTHGHVSWILGKKENNDVRLVGVFEKNAALVQQQIKSFQLSPSLFYTDLNKMLDEVKPQTVVAFGSIYDHLAVVEACAPRGIHVMVEKPLAVSNEHAMRMASLAQKHNIILLTNYETSWYPATAKSYELAVEKKYVGKIRKAVFHHGHEGPKEIGVGKEFLDWLTDPKLNGGGALIDFGCYGANIMTWLMGNTKPIAVTAVTRQFKPSVYPRVDDEATIIVEYPDAQCIIQASWNWPFGRKDMEVYGDEGYVITADAVNMRYKNKSTERETINVADTKVYADPFRYFADVIRKKITVTDYSLYSLSNNLTVVQILDAARESAKTGTRVVLNNK